MNNKLTVLIKQTAQSKFFHNFSKNTLSELNSLRTRVTELTQQMTKTLNDVHESQLKNTSLTSENLTLQTKLRTFES